MATFLSRDALLLFAIAYECQHKGVATLEGIFSAEDAINRSAPEYDELVQGLEMLLSAELISNTADGYTLTADGEKHYAFINEETKGVFEKLQLLAEKLRAQFGDIGPRNNVTLSREEYQQAYEAYCRRT